MTEILDCPEGVVRCASIVKEGGVVVFPTDTVYGIGCDPYSDSSVARIFEIKGRQEDKPLPVLAASTEDAEKIVKLDLHLGQCACTLMHSMQKSAAARNSDSSPR